MCKVKKPKAINPAAAPPPADPRFTDPARLRIPRNASGSAPRGLQNLVINRTQSKS